MGIHSKKELSFLMSLGGEGGEQGEHSAIRNDRGEDQSTGLDGDTSQRGPCPAACCRSTSYMCLHAPRLWLSICETGLVAVAILISSSALVRGLNKMIHGSA